MAVRKTLPFWILIFCFWICANAEAYTWKTIDKGLSYALVDNVHAFQIDPKVFKLSVTTAKDFAETDTTAQRVAKKSKAILVVNGGFFSPEHKSLGLLMRDGKIINPIHLTPWWAIFYIDKGKASMTLPRYFIPTPTTEMALQVGPRLVVNGETLKLKPSADRRSGIGIQPNGNLIIAIADDTERSMEEFANLFKKSQAEGGLECSNALNLDGGGSTQLYIDWNGFKLDIPGLSRIANAIAVFPRH